MSNAGTVQNVQGAIPILARVPPPEGQMAAQVPLVFTPFQFNYSNTFQLNAQSGLFLSQVVSLIIDNSGNPYPVQVTHGALQQTITVPGYTETIIPTFSARGFYSLEVGLLSVPVDAVSVNLILLNYERGVGAISETIPNTLQGSSLYSTVISFTGVSSSVFLPPANYALIDIEMVLSYMYIPVAGAGQVLIIIFSDVSLPVTSLLASAYASTPGYQPCQFRTARQFSTPLYLPRGNNLTFSCTYIYNCNYVQGTLNVSGFTLS
jgi:hypothetical protein